MSKVPCSSSLGLGLSDWQKEESESRGDPESETSVVTLNDGVVTPDDDPLFGRGTASALRERLDLESLAVFLDVRCRFGSDPPCFRVFTVFFCFCFGFRGDFGAFGFGEDLDFLPLFELVVIGINRGSNRSES